jgi:prepilin-type processing-associated H-X9-DG protein
MRRTKKVLAVSAFVTIAAVALVAIREMYQLSLESHCRLALRNIYSGWRLYRDEQAGQWPPDLKSLQRNADMVDESFVCPGMGHVLPDGSGKYVYVNWSPQVHFPEVPRNKFPLIYDATLRNHGGRGINTLMVDGSVQWDPHVDWLARFRAEHPDAEIPIPN